MLESRTLAGLFGMGLFGLSVLPAAAQSWPSDSGPSGDYLGATVRQFDRLAPPPIEESGRGERVIPDMPPSDVPGASVDVGLPAVAPVPLTRPAGFRRAPHPRETNRRVRAVAATVPRSRGREAELTRALADRDRQIQDLRRQLDQSR